MLSLYHEKDEKLASVQKVHALKMKRLALEIELLKVIEKGKKVQRKISDRRDGRASKYSEAQIAEKLGAMTTPYLQAQGGAGGDTTSNGAADAKVSLDMVRCLHFRTSKQADEAHVKAHIRKLEGGDPRTAFYPNPKTEFSDFSKANPGAKLFTSSKATATATAVRRSAGSKKARGKAG